MKLPEYSCVNIVENVNGHKSARWLFDCGATDTMTYNKLDIMMSQIPQKDFVQIASGELAPVEGLLWLN